MRTLALAIAIAAALASSVAAQPSIAILTGSTSGVYYPLGHAISAIFLKTIPGARSSVQVTQGSIENLRLLEDGDGELAFSLGDRQCALTVLSLVQYAGGLFVPFRDLTSGRETYGGGRYLFDTAKDTDGLVLELEAGSSDVVIDFNFAYNASCAYSPRWACPLAPPENHMQVAVRAGERVYKEY